MSSAQVFTDNWNVYQQIVQHNYMHHHGFEQQTALAWSSLVPPPTHVLDIGCGDTGTMLPHLLKHPEAAFTGYDLSGRALELAAVNLEQLPNNVQLKEGDMLGLLNEEPQKFNLIHSSFAIHHLQDENKRQLYKACFDHLEPGGLFLYTDVFRQAGQTREEYIDRYFEFVEEEWTGMATWEKQIVYDHVQAYDFPSAITHSTEWLQAVGFTVLGLYQPDERHMMLQLIR